MTRVQRLLDKRIIREITPIFDTRALGYQSMLVAAKVDAEHPHRAAKIINSHPGVTHNYLRNHDFNLWFTHRRRAGLEARAWTARSTCWPPRPARESIRQLPTLKLFKIRMDLEMEAGTDALAAAGEAVEPRELDPIELSTRSTSRPSAPPRARCRSSPSRTRRPPSGSASPERGARAPESLRERGGLRRVAAILYHRRAGFSANGMGVWKVPEDDDPRRPAGGWPRSAASRTATSGPTYAGLAVLGLHDGPRPLEGGVRRDPRLDRARRRASASARRCTPPPSSRRSGCSISPTTSGAGRQEHGA